MSFVDIKCVVFQNEEENAHEHLKVRP